MAHQVEHMFYVGETPWHGYGKAFERAPTVAEALRRVPEMASPIERVPLVIKGTDIEVPMFAHLRTLDKKCVGMGGSKYLIQQPLDSFAWVDHFIQTGQAELHTGGLLREGALMWILAKITGSSQEIVKGDEVLQFILLSTSHDGSAPTRCGLTAIRTVCANTLAVAHTAASSKLMRVKHTKNAPIAMSMVRDALDLSRREFSATMDGMRAMARVGVNEDDLKHYVREVFEVENGQDGDKAADRLYNKIVPMFEGGRGSGIRGVKGTLWGAYNAVTEFLTWERGRSQDTRLESLWFGESAAISQKALDTAMLLAA